MGRSKFPGKPSKSVMKERIRVLYKDENGKCGKDAYSNYNEKNSGENSSSNDFSLQTTSVSCKVQLDSDPNSTVVNLTQKTTSSLEDPAGTIVTPSTVENVQNLKHYSGDILGQDEQTNMSTTESCAENCNIRNTKYSFMELDKFIKKKTVTFKNVLETSDDTSVIKKIHNPINKGPLVSIMKKECSTSQSYMTRGDGIVRPSRLTEILRNNENIDKTKSLSFRSVQALNNLSDSCESKRLDAAQPMQYPLSIREGSPKIIFLGKERKNGESEFNSQSETIEKSGYQTSEDNSSQLMDKWKLHKLCSKSDDYDTRDDHIEGECRIRSPKKKDSPMHNKIILRQPRLHFEPQREILVKGKQSHSNNSNNASLLVTNLGTYAVCGVCNTSVNSKHLQNRKYGIIACDACRKFISKITKKSISSSMNPLAAFKIQCSKQDGECIISSLPKNNVKNFKKIYEERCSACWLKKCIKAFHFPSGHKLRLNAILSETHKNKIDVKSVNKSCDSLPSKLVNTFKYGSELSDNDHVKSLTNSMSWRETTSGRMIESVKSYGEFAAVNDNVEPFLDSNLTFDVFSKLKQPPCIKLLNNNDSCSKGNSRFYSNSIFNKKAQSILCKSIDQSENPTPEYPKRQKIDFKGPRVKHVCRSASIALGQQIATFSNDNEEDSKLLQSEIENSSFTNSLLGNIYFSGNDQENCSQKTIEGVRQLQKQFENGENRLKQGFALNTEGKKPPSHIFANIEKNQGACKDKKTILFDKSFIHEKNNYHFQKSAQKCTKNKNLFMLSHGNISSLSKRNLMRITKARSYEKKSKFISIDFWDTYVPAEVNQTGFGLILTEPASICALCFLCGSMDLDYLLFCASCCEPYHSYCIPEENDSIYTISQNKNIPSDIKKKNELLNQLNWICPRCTVCFTCNMSSGAKIKCQKCKKNYHSTCMGTSKGLLGADRPLICRNCLKCQTCSTTKVLKYVGNQPICMQCFKLRKSGIRCPFCNNFFDNILDLIILECDICKELIHAKCEGLTEEQSNLLSNLPEYIKFVCKKCSLSNDNAKILAKEWREAVYEELKAGLLAVLKLLSRCRQANVLKKSTKNHCLCDYRHKITKEGYITENEYNLVGSALYSKCLCSNSFFQQKKINNSLSLFDIKKKIINGEYVSLFDFNADMNDVIMPLKNDELILAYKEILSEKFSWFQNETKTCTDALEEDMFESCNYSFQLDETVVEDQNTTTKLPNSGGKILNSIKEETDNRVCIFCLKEGDGGVLQESRLLYYGYNAWVHANCALWSNDVYEEFDSTLQNVQTALNRGRLLKCALCKWSGATVKCFVKTCCNNYHFKCARKAKCIFKSDKSIYCSNHYTEEKDSNCTTKETFTVFRPLYIEFDKSRRKYVEPCKVQFMMGSLSVIQLGSVYSKFSDTSEAIVPINFICTRLYWSCREPWKIVKYNVRTLIQHSSVTFGNDMGKNFTVDHSKNVNIVESGLSQIANWHSTLTRDENLDANLHYEYGHFGNLRFSSDGDNHNETNSDACIEEEPQNNSDLLPPEIKDAIFEDLPHDILEGISMLDIFPKLMIYEDLIAIEGKSDNMLLTEAENGCIQNPEDCPSFNCLSKPEPNNKCTSNIMNQIEEKNYTTVHTICAKRELQRSNSEIFLKNYDGYRSQQRSSSVTWSCKFDNTRRYFAKGLTDVGHSETKVFNSNYKKSENENDNYITDSKQKIMCEDKHLTQIKKEKFKLMQLDGTDDTVMGYLSTNVQNLTNKSPVKCDRCHCTYRTFDSFQRHLPNCEQISASESETETSNPDASRSLIVFQEDSIKNNLQLYCNKFASDQKFSSNISNANEPSIITSEQTLPQNIFVANSAKYADGFYVNINKTIDVNHKNTHCINNDESSWHNVSSVGVSNFNKSINKNKKTKYNYNCSSLNNTAENEQYKVCVKNKQGTIVTPDTVDTINDKTEYNMQGKHNYLQLLNQHLALNSQYSQKEQQSQQQQFVIIQQSVGNNQPLFIQQVSSPPTIPQNIFPVVLSNNSMQYTSIPTSTNPLMQGSILQTDASGNILLSSGLQMLSMPSLQLTSQSPQLVGSFNQPQSLHLGSNPMIIGGTAAMEIIPNANQVLLTAPPVYYGLETIVQNTVMSSQQFVSTAMQGVLSQNASFSATTTQVFQSSKFEPVSDAPSSYVVLNNADGTALVVPQANLLSSFLNTNSAHDFHSNYAQDFGNIYGTNPQALIQQPQHTSFLPLIPTISDMTCIPVENPANRIQTTVNLENNSNIASPGKRTIASTAIHNISPKNASSTPSQTFIQNSSICNMEKCDLEEISLVTNDYENDFNVKITYNESGVYKMGRKSLEVNNIHSKHKVRVKPKVTNKCIKRNRTAKNTQIDSKLTYRNNLKKEFKLDQHKETIPDNLINKSTGETDTHHEIGEEDVQYLPSLNAKNIKGNNDPQNCSEINNKRFNVLKRVETSEDYLELEDSIQNIVPRSNNRPTAQLYVMNTTKLPLTTTSFGNNNVPTNIVSPILQAHQSNNTPSRPTNRVLPMQSVHKLADKSKLKSATLKMPAFRDNLNKLIDISSSDVEVKKEVLPTVHNIEKNNNAISVDHIKELELKNMVEDLKSNKEVPEMKSNISYFANRLNSLEKFPVAENTLDVKKIANQSYTDISLHDVKESSQNELKDRDNSDCAFRSQLCDEKADDQEKKLMIESIEVYTNTHIQKLYDEPTQQSEFLEIVKGACPSKFDFKIKSTKQVPTDQYHLPKLSQTTLNFPSKTSLHNEDIRRTFEPHLIYEIQSEDGFSYKSNSIADVWEKVFEAVQSARRVHGLSSLPIGPFADMCGVQIIGLKTNALKFLIEQLPGMERCTKYTPKYHKNTSANSGSEYGHQDQEELLETIYGAVRCEPFTKRSDYDLFSWLASRHRKQPKQIFVQPSDTESIARRCTANLPMAMKYRTLKETCKHNVGVFRSLIHGRGLFCTKDIEAGEMVIEYAGELIRSTLTDKREKFYDSRGIGCYMFKIDENSVVDATMRGNAARFINHSCEPNCYSKVVDILGHKHIIIFSLRRIVQGEELTYDYKFPFEDVKIPCSCGSKRCRKYLN